jgi:uncharacterized membrane protein YidH (DUF202 family)
MLKLMKPVAAVLIFTLAGGQALVFAGPVPSKTAVNQDLAARATDLALARNLFATDRIAKALEAEGVALDQIDARLSALSSADLIALGQNPAQVRSAGVTMTKRAWTIAGIVAGAVVVGAFALKQNDDDEDEDGSDDGED